MVALTAVALGLAAASLGAGVYEKVEGDAKSKAAYDQMAQGQQVAAMGAAQMHNVSVAQAQASVGFAGQNLAINNQANQYSVQASQQSAAINSQIINYNQQIQNQQRQAMELDASRQQIQNARSIQQARAQSLAVGISQGGSGYTRGSSALGGAYGQIAGQGTRNALNISQNLGIGENIANLNQNISQQNLAMQQLNTTYAQQRADTQTQMSNLLYQNAVSNAGFQTQYADAQQTISQGQGITAMGQGQLGQGQMQSQLGGQLISAAPSILSAGINLQQIAPTMANYFNTPTSVGAPMDITPSFGSASNGFIGPTQPYNAYNQTGSFY